MKMFPYSEIKKLDAINFAPITNLISEKIDAINILFGRLPSEQFPTLGNLESLIEDCLAEIRKDKNATPTIETGYMIVKMWVGGERDEKGEENVHIGITYRLIEM